ncbi:hypothetical protein AB0J71_49775 [Nonomuraea sp. NPDC049637]|uniref:hypothetical protein n=1 Tax=Nonomuraea sp. NPDC049637 TaxID=3154356 RepID=UPI00341247C8
MAVTDAAIDKINQTIQDLEGFLGGEGAAQVAEVDDLFRRHLAEQQPQRLAFALGLESHSALTTAEIANVQPGSRTMIRLR